MLIINAFLHTMTGQNIENGYLRAEDGVIREMGPMPVKPSEEEIVYDAQGAGLYPGFIDAHTHLGMWEDGLTFEGDDGNEETDPVTPQMRAIDAINPVDRCFREALAAGITTVVTGPGSANAIGGQMAAIKTYGCCIDQMIIKAPVAIKMALGENPKTVYHGKNQAPCTRMCTAALIREQLYKAKRYMEEKERAEQDEEFDLPEYDMKCEALLPALRRETEVHFHAHRADDIFTAVRIAKEFQLDYVVIHGTEGHLVAGALREEGARVLSGPFLCDRSKPELRNLTPETPGVLAGNGVPTAIITDHPVIPIQYLPLCAGLAVREGMRHEDALRAITVHPAQICGIDSRVGTLEIGKDADMVLFDGDPLTVAAKPRMVFARGEQVQMERMERP
ncbi:amidohydrolase [Clostridium sp. D33t1_170424_F3]|uniref:amidohydrolase n=1 Tax=Clostridium sp. D33t1_170424_F3 TaxID=2787099 RepID=UPI0018A8C29E|nr:amidohydrolase [Clostridium sp. D33t1_170424_F3]